MGVYNLHHILRTKTNVGHLLGLISQEVVQLVGGGTLVSSLGGHLTL